MVPASRRPGTPSRPQTFEEGAVTYDDIIDCLIFFVGIFGTFMTVTAVVFAAIDIHKKRKERAVMNR